MATVEDYLKAVDKPQRKELERIRKIINKAVPEAEETISYQIPVYKYKGSYLIGYAAFKNHMSLFPGSMPIVDLKDKLRDYKLSKGTVQFTLEKPISEVLIKELVNNCLKRITKE